MSMLKSRVVRVCLTSTVTRNLHRERVIDTSRDDDEDEQEEIGIHTITEFIEREKPVAHLRLKLISEGLLFYKMLVDYEENCKEKHHEAHGSKSSILIPNNATNIKVRFQVMRALGVWCDVKEYDRFKKCWVEPTKPHIFEYNKPVSCTYTLDGNLFYEAVMKVSGDDKALKYSCKSPCSSKMVVDYEENGEKKHREGHGSGSLILIPHNATKIKVKFQVKRAPPSVWCDVKEYDRWVEPIKPLIFKYDRPKKCKYILTGNFFHEKDTPSDQVRGSEATTSSSIQDIGTQVKGLDELEMDEKKKSQQLWSASKLMEYWFQELKQESLKEVIRFALLWSASERLEETNKELKQKSSKEKISLESVTSQRQDKDVYDEEVLSPDWFVQNILDENLNMKEEYEEELSRLCWVRDFYIGFDGKKDKTWKIFITHAQDEEPSMKELREIFGEKQIASFVDFIPEQIKKVTGKSRFLRGPKTGDGVHKEHGNFDGTIGIICVGISYQKSHYAIASYHVCFNGKLPDDLLKAHDLLMQDCRRKSVIGDNAIYKFYDGSACRTLGTFYCGLYNNEHDIALIKLDKDLFCHDHNTFFNKEKMERTLASKKEMMKKMEEMDGSVPVRVIGLVTKYGKGNLTGINVRTPHGKMNKGFYRIENVNEEVFAKEGDSGALVYMICNDGKKIPFAYVSNVNENGIYFCGDLKFSLGRINPDMKTCQGVCLGTTT